MTAPLATKFSKRVSNKFAISGNEAGNTVYKFGKFKVGLTKVGKTYNITLDVNYRKVFASGSQPIYLTLDPKKNPKKKLQCRLTLKKFTATIQDDCKFYFNKREKTFVIKFNNIRFSMCKSNNVVASSVNTHCFLVTSSENLEKKN